MIGILISTLSFVEKKQEDIPCRFINVKILDSLYNGFVTKEDVYKVIQNNHSGILGTPLSSINTRNLEKKILVNRAIKTCDVYNTADGQLFVEIMQRQPVLRIMNARNETYYIDEEGYLIPFTSIKTPNILIATGEIKENKRLDLKKHGHINALNIDGKQNILKDLHELSMYIYNDQFWRSQFVQIYVDKKGELELIPRVGAHIIILGNCENFETKLKKLKTLYYKGFNTLGWNQYETINLKFKNQVICSKR